MDWQREVEYSKIIKINFVWKGKFKMAEKLVNSIIAAFGGITSIAFGKEILVFIISLMPILELNFILYYSFYKLITFVL